MDRAERTGSQRGEDIERPTSVAVSLAHMRDVRSTDLSCSQCWSSAMLMWGYHGQGCREAAWERVEWTRCKMERVKGLSAE
jgi:hypothetical protein